MRKPKKAKNPRQKRIDYCRGCAETFTYKADQATKRGDMDAARNYRLLAIEYADEADFLTKNPGK